MAHFLAFYRPSGLAQLLGAAYLIIFLYGGCHLTFPLLIIRQASLARAEDTGGIVSPH